MLRDPAYDADANGKCFFRSWCWKLVICKELDIEPSWQEVGRGRIEVTILNEAA
jgi:hypothetical protein